jgi:type I restriction enzyme, S subunit
MSAPDERAEGSPEDWPRKKLKYIASLKSGDAIDANDISDGGEYPVYGGNGLRGYTSRFSHHGDYILIGRQGALCGNINYASGSFWASEHAIVVDTQGQVEVRWLGELLRSMNLNQYSQSAAQPGLAVDLIANLVLPVPPVAEQRAIADYLDREIGQIDALVAAKERLSTLLAEKRRALITRAVTRGLDPDVSLRESGLPWLGQMPAHWQVKKLKYIALLKSGDFIASDSIAPIGDYPVFGGNGVRGFSSAFTHDGNYVLIGRQGALCGNINYASGRFWATEHAVVVHIQGEHEFVWLGELLRVMNLNQFSQSAAQPGLAVEVVANLGIAVPSIEEQRAIVAHIAAETAPLDILAAATERSMALLRERRAALIAAVVTRRIEVT